MGEGRDLVRECLAIDRPGRYQILPAINAFHTDALTGPDTDWPTADEPGAECVAASFDGVFEGRHGHLRLGRLPGSALYRGAGLYRLA